MLIRPEHCYDSPQHSHGYTQNSLKTASESFGMKQHYSGSSLAKPADCGCLKVSFSSTLQVQELLIGNDHRVYTPSW